MNEIPQQHTVFITTQDYHTYQAVCSDCNYRSHPSTQGVASDDKWTHVNGTDARVARYFEVR